MLELLHEDNVKCKTLLTSLEKRFLPSLQIERQRVIREFTGFTRGSRSLMQAVKDLKLVLLECHKQKYKPDADTIMLKYESLVPQTNFPLLNLYKMKVDQSGTDMDIFMRAIEDLALHHEGPAPKLPGQGSSPFAGATGAVGGYRGGNGDRNKSKGFRGGQDTSTKCSNCGNANCPTMKGEARDRCFAFNKECKNCQKKGHFMVTCRQPKQAAPTAQAGAALEGF